MNQQQIKKEVGLARAQFSHKQQAHALATVLGLGKGVAVRDDHPGQLSRLRGIRDPQGRDISAGLARLLVRYRFVSPISRDDVTLTPWGWKVLKEAGYTHAPNPESWRDVREKQASEKARTALTPDLAVQVLRRAAGLRPNEAVSQGTAVSHEGMRRAAAKLCPGTQRVMRQTLAQRGYISPGDTHDTLTHHALILLGKSGHPVRE